MIRRTLLCLTAAGTLLACGGYDTPTGPQDTRRTSSFSAALDDPSRCTCDGGLRTYTIQVATAGRVDAVATVQPADARLVVRLLDSTVNVLHAVSAQQGATARLGFDAVPATYVVQVFLASDGPRQATFSLDLTYP